MLATEIVNCQITVSPPRRSDGVASMLVALGDAGMGVSQARPRADDGGMYILTVAGDPGRAKEVLESIGCLVVDSIQQG